MINYLKTLQEAKAYRYNRWAGNPDGNEYCEGYCAGEVTMDRYVFHQCRRKNGKGPDGLYCTQHAKMIIEREARK